MAIAFLSTLAVQIGSACFNNFRSKKHAQDLARKQQAYEEKVVREGIENARSEFAELCAFQREMEIEMQKDRLNLIRANHENSLIQAAYENSLGSWPLMVPPYVIKNDTILSVNLQPEKAIPLNCILTTSSDNKFNKAVFYKLEEAIACFCSKYWNVSANKSIRFFQESWRDNFKDIGVKHKDLYAHLSDVPTLVISPVIKNGKLIFRFYWWGLSVDPSDAHLNDVANELDPEVNITIEANHNYTEEEVATILSVCEPRIEAFISFFADIYYWNFYKATPLLPSLIGHKSLALNDSDCSEYMESYVKLISKRLDNSHILDVSSELNFIESIADTTNPKDLSCLISKATVRIKNIPLLSSKEIIRISEFSNNFGSSEMTHIIDSHLSAQIEEVEIIDELDSLTDEIIVSFVKDNHPDAVNPYNFVFIDWSKNMYIGTFCDEDFTPTIYSESNTVRFFIFRSTNYSEDEAENKNKLLNIIPIVMSSKDKNLSGRERLGRRLINLGNRLCNDAHQSKSPRQASYVNNAWGDASNERSYDLSTIVNYFIEGVNNNTIHYTQCGSNMSLSDVLNWLDNLSDSQVGFSNQVYLIRGEYEEKRRVLYCAFLAKDDKFDLSSATKECFICESESIEMKEAFSGKSIYVIPFED
ncbi:MAG: hypothetical protein NC115_01420 [Bacteroidales bacterium]|nr:hypothetical protein [Bacteroidales bacterium]